MSAYQTTMPERLCEFLKLVRSTQLSARQIAVTLGWSQHTVGDWCREFEANGILRQCGEARVGKRGARSKTYTLAAEWRGAVTADDEQVRLLKDSVKEFA